MSMEKVRQFINSVPDKRVALQLLGALDQLVPTNTDTALTAHAGGGQANALLLRSDRAFHDVTTVASAADSVALPNPHAGDFHFIKNSAAANAMQVYAVTPGTIDSVATGTGVSQLAGDGVFYFCVVDGNYVRLGGVAADEIFSEITVPVIDMTGTTGAQEIRLTANLADALSIEDTTGDLVVFDTSTNALTIKVDKLAGLNLGAFASTADGSGFPLSTTRTAAVRIYSDDAGIALGAVGSVPDMRGLLSRMLVTEDATANKIRVHALMGHLKAYAATGDVGIWNDEQAAGVYGYVELVRASGTATYGDYGLTAAVLGCFENSGAITVNTNHVFAGVAAISKLTSDLTQTGKTAAFYAGIYDTTNWSDGTARSTWGYGMFINQDSVVRGVHVGVLGSNITGGVPMSGATTINGFFSDDNGVDQTTGTVLRNVTARTYFSVDQTAAAADYHVIRGHLKAASGVDFGGDTSVKSGVHAYMELAGNTTVGAGAFLAGVLGEFWGDGNIVGTGKAAGVMARLYTSAGTTSGTTAAFMATKQWASTQDWPYGLYIDSGTVDIRLQSGSTIADANHLDIETLDDTKRVRLNDRNYAATSGDIIGFSAKPAANATGTQTVYGGQISPRANDNIDVTALIGLQIEPIMKGATGLAISGDLRGLDVRLTSEGANNVGGIAGAIFCYNQLKSATFTGGVYPIVVKANSDTQAWTALMEIPAVLSGAADGIGAAVYIPITIGGTAARITAKYVS